MTRTSRCESRNLSPLTHEGPPGCACFASGAGQLLLLQLLQDLAGVIHGKNLLDPAGRLLMPFPVIVKASPER